MSHYVYGNVQANCDVETMARVLENMVPEWKGKIEWNEAGDLKLGSDYQQAGGTYHIHVPRGQNGIRYEDFGMRREGDKWVVALGGHSTVAGKAQTKFEEELPGEIGRLRAKNMVNKMGIFNFEEEEEEDDFVFKFKVDGDDLLSKI